MGNVPYDIEKDFTPVTNLGSVPLLVTAYPGHPAKNLKEFLAAIRAEPKKYVFGTSAVGSASHLAEEAIKYEAKVDFTIVPYKGTAPALTDVMGGHISAMVDALPSTMPHVKSGKLKPLAVTSAKRVASLPDVPTVAESGLDGFEMVSWYGLWGPPNMPPELVVEDPAGSGEGIEVAAGRQGARRVWLRRLGFHARGVQGVHQAGVGEVREAHQGREHPARELAPRAGGGGQKRSPTAIRTMSFSMKFTFGSQVSRANHDR